MKNSIIHQSHQDLATQESIARFQNQQRQVGLISSQLNESTSLTWLWALLFGPLYFAVHGFWGRAFIILVLNFFFFLGVIVSPFLAYEAWRTKAKTKASNWVALDALRNNR